MTLEDLLRSAAFSLVLHTWGQELQRHIHVHAVVACGVLDKTGQWATPIRKPDFLFLTPALSTVFRGKFVHALSGEHKSGQIARDPQGAHTDWCKQQRLLYKHDWVGYANAQLGGPAQVLEYLSRYTHRTAVSNERIRSISEDEVAFTVRAKDKGGKRLHRMDGCEFVRRFLLHVLPTGVKRVRHYGMLACKGKKLNAALLAQMDVGLCPVCKVVRLRTVEVLAGAKQLPAPGARVWPLEWLPPRVMDKGAVMSRVLHAANSAGEGRAACSVGKARSGLQKLGWLV